MTGLGRAARKGAAVDGRAIRAHWMRRLLSTTALCGVLALGLAAAPAFAAGGAGGAGGTGAGGAGGAAGSGAGGDGSFNGGGGGGGGNAGGNAGGQGGAGVTGNNAAGGTSGHIDGYGGDSGSSTGGGGGGGGGYGGANGTSGSPTGGNGGNGGDGGSSTVSGGGGGGGGGSGGYGLDVTGTSANNSGTITGGTGGNGGAGGAGFERGGDAGNGGDGGIGILFNTSGATLTNNGLIQGGAGGTGGTGGTGGSLNGSAGLSGSGGVGVVGSGLTIDNSGGTITGGVNGDAISRAFAIEFTGGTNSIGGGAIQGGISVTGGSFAPALSTSPIGTGLTIDGPLTFGSGTQYDVRFSSTTSDYASLVTSTIGGITSTGLATLTGASVSAQFNNDAWIKKQYTILSAAGGFSGSFSGVTTNLPSWTTSSLSYGPTLSPTNVYLNLDTEYSNTSGLNTNQLNTATALENYFTTNGTLPTKLFELRKSELTTADGEVATGVQTVSFQLSDQFLSMLLGPLYSAPSSSGGLAMGYADQRPAISPAAQRAYDGLMGKATAALDPAIWVTAFGGANTNKGNNTLGSSNTNAQTGGLAMGVEHELAPGLMVGVAAAGGGTHWTLSDAALGNGHGIAAQAGAYARAHAGPVYLSVAGDFTNQWFSTSRTTAGDQITADFMGQSYGGRAETGIRFGSRRGMGLTPFVGGTYQAVHTPAYSETDKSGGGLSLSYGAKTVTDTRSEVGAQFDTTKTTASGGSLLFFSRFAWAHRWSSDDPSLAASFTALPGTTFTVNGAARPKDQGLVSVGAQVAASNGWSWRAQFDGAFGKRDQTYGGTASLRYQW